MKGEILMNPTLRNWLIILVVGAAIWFSPIPAGLKPDAWHIFAVFVATVSVCIISDGLLSVLDIGDSREIWS